jgi:nicotinate dehydrogenase subunit A
MALTIRVNGQRHVVTSTPDTPLLYVLRNEIGLQGPKFGCGLSQCGACTVHLAGKPIRSCVTPVVGVTKHPITTLEGLAASYHGPGAAKGLLHPVQQAWIDIQVPQCGYCQNGWIMYSAALLARNSRPTDKQIRAALTGLKCRCGTQVRILRAVHHAAAMIG